MFNRHILGCNALEKCLLGLIVSGLLLCWPGTASAQSPELTRAYRQGQALQKKGRYKEAIPFYQKALEFGVREFGPDHETTATLINNLAFLYNNQGRYADAEPLYKRSLAINEKALGSNHPEVAISLNNLAMLYRDQGRYADAEPLLKRALAINEKALGPDHPSVALGLNNLAALYDDQGRYADAEPLYKRSLAIREKALGPEHPDVALSLNNLAALYDDQGRYADAEPLYKRSLAIWEKALGPDHPSVALGLNNLAALYVAQGRYGDAEPLFKRSLAIREKALGPGHPDVAGSLNNLAALYEGQGKESEGLELFRRATVIHQGRAARPGGRSAGGLSEQKSVRFLFTSHVRTAANLAGKEPSRRVPLTAETFAVGQLARATQAGAAVSRMAARFAAGNDDLAETVRGHQDAVALWQRLDADLIKVVSAPPAKRNPAREKALRERLDDLDARIAGLSKKLAAEFPDYAELAAAKPVPLGDVQKLFNPEEALVAYLVSDKKTYVWAVRRDRAEIFVANIDQNELSEAVARLRGGLDPSGITRLKDIPPFNRTEAYKLYKKIFAPAEPLLDGARHVFVVADGALESLPLGVLVTEEPQGEFKDFSGYRQVPWLAKKYALSTLPSVSSLRALRTFAKAARAKRPFIGFGDPVLEGRPGEARSVSLASLYRGAIADVEAVRQLSPLPDTANELRAMATILHADEKQIYLREAATETAVKSANLSDIRVLAFATHGLVGGEFKGNVEPALVLTPPKEGTAEDDGLLTASEVATLKLNADLVILSACNTAAPDGTPEAEGLSGLAKAFFYAGSRALLVSHWPVASDAAVKLTTGMLERVAAHPERGRADALRRSMLALMEDIDKPHYAHPMFWAPFVVVGEGGTPVK